MSIKKRLQDLESRQPSGDTRCFLAMPYGDDYELIHLKENGQDEFQIMTEDEFKQWERKQDASVTIIRLVYEDTLNN